MNPSKSARFERGKDKSCIMFDRDVLPPVKVTYSTAKTLNITAVFLSLFCETAFLLRKFCSGAAFFVVVKQLYLCHVDFNKPDDSREEKVDDSS